jgi:hypothetical protein
MSRWILSSWLLFFGCSGVVGEPLGGSERTPSPRDPSESPIGADGRLEPPPAGLRALTRAQYEASVRDVLGLGLTDDAPIDDLGNWDSSIAARSGVASPTLTESYADAAFALAAWATAPERRARFVSCEPDGSPTDACVLQVLDTIGRRALRGSLDAEDRTRWLGLAHEAARELDDPWAGVEHVLAGLLQSPRFLYRVELPVASAEDARPYTDHAMAMRVSYLVWGSTPDDALLDAAEAGELASDEGLARQLDRLLSDPRAEHGLRAFVDELFETHQLLHARRTSDEHPDFERDREAMHESFLRTAAAIVERDGLAGLFDSRRAVVNREVARYLGLDPTSLGETFAEHELDGRAGLLTMPAFLAATANEHSTSATRRGLFVRRRLLCGIVAPPPSDIDTTLPEEVTRGPSTARMRLDAHQDKGTVCYGCHVKMDPLGLALEQFDQVGAFRTHEQGLPIDPSGELDGDGFADAVGFAEAMAGHPAVLPCLAGRAYEMGAGVPITSLSRDLDELAAADWPDLVRTLAGHPAFRRAWGELR